MTEPNGSEPERPASFAPMVPPFPLPTRSGSSVVRLGDGTGRVLLQVHNAGGMAFAFLDPREAESLAESLVRNAQLADLATPPRGLHLPE